MRVSFPPEVVVVVDRRNARRIMASIIIIIVRSFHIRGWFHIVEYCHCSKIGGG